MSRNRFIVLAAAVTVVATAALVSLAVVGGRSPSAGHHHALLLPPPPPLPGSMASAGDSITRAFDVDSRHLLQDTPADSWSTGSDPGVQSHYYRILVAHPAVAGHVYNFAQSGARMVALDGQLQAAGAQKVDYLTVLMGANDLCAPTIAAMTPTSTFRAQFDRALSDFFAADPGAHVLVASIPDLFQLWNTLQFNMTAQLTWALTHICPSMLAGSATAADRQAVVSQEQADNASLVAVCRHYVHCRDDGGAVYRSPITATDVSTVDYFHPSVTGQARLASITWATGYWPATP